jgi:hypothetical protein
VHLRASSRGANAARLSSLCLKQRFRRLFRFDTGANDCRSASWPLGNKQEIACAFSRPPGRYMRAMHHRRSICIRTGSIGGHGDSRRHRPARPFPSPHPLGWPDTNLGRSESCALFIWSAGFPNRTVAIESTIHARLFFLVQRSITLWP